MFVSLVDDKFLNISLKYSEYIYSDHVFIMKSGLSVLKDFRLNYE